MKCLDAASSFYFLCFFAIRIDIPSLHIPIRRANRIFPTTFFVRVAQLSQAKNPTWKLVVTALTTKPKLQ
mgnify:CR=1 FL=1